jgi:hypothetical protein
MTKREENILEIINRHYSDLREWNINAAKEIASLPLDVPTDIEWNDITRKKFSGVATIAELQAYQLGGWDMRSEIEKRNK